MARRLVWMCGGVVAVGVLVRLCVALISHEADPAQANSAARAPSTPASASSQPQDPVLGIERSIQQKLLKDGTLVPPGPEASPQEQKAYELVMEAKQQGANDSQAIHQAAERIWQQKQAEHDRRI